MVDMPKHTTKKITRHEWFIGDDYSDKGTARTLMDGILFAKREMEELGVDLGFDDSFYFKSVDGGQIVLFVDIESE